MRHKFTFRAMFMVAMMFLGMATSWADEQPVPVYFNDFSSTDGLTIVGSGQFEDDADARFGKIYHNDPTLTKAIRTNYLLLPADVLSQSAETKEMTIGFWVNMKDAADFYWSPLFAAYDKVERAANADEPWPHFVLMARKEVALNCWGYCDLGNTYNDNGTNAQTSAWLDDKAWHYYTATLTKTSVKVYIDGVLENSWTFDGTTGGQIVEGVFNAGAAYNTNDFGLKYICLGGNQACNWADPDPAFGFDDFAVYDKALTADQIKDVIRRKMAAQTTFDFTSPTISDHIGTAVTDASANIYNETFTVDGASLQVTAGSAPSKIYTDANRGQCLVTYKDYATLTFRAPEGKAITKIQFTAAGNSNINGFTASSGTITGMTWTGDAEGVRFQQGATSWLANAIVSLADKVDATATLPAINYTECANIAAFNALEAGTYAKVTLTDAEVIGKSADGFSTVWLQDATGGCLMQYTSLNATLQEQTKVSGTLYTVKRVASGNIQMKEAEDTPASTLSATAITGYSVLEGTLAELNIEANKGKLVKIAADKLEETSATAGTLTQGEATIIVNNGSATANQQLHKIADWAQGNVLENVTVVAILVAKSATENQLLPLSVEATPVEEADATFDFAANPENWPVSTALFDDPAGVVTELTVDGVKLTSIQNNEWNANLLYKDGDNAPVFRVAKENAFKLTAPEGKAVVKVVVTMAGEQAFDFTADNGTIADGQWTGNATEVTFTTTANRSISKINVFLADENGETVKPAAAVEVANIAAFNAAEDGTTVKLTLTDARVNAVNGGSYYVEDASGATVVKGLTLTPGTKLNGYVVGVKSTDDQIDFMNTPAVAVEYQLTATDASTFEATETTLDGTVMTLTEAGAQANYGRLVTFESVAITGAGQNKTLTDAQNNTFKARDYMGVLPAGYEWPAKAAKITGVVVYYMTGWVLMPISAEAIVADESGVDGIAAVSTDGTAASEPVYSLQGVRQSRLQRGLNIVGGRKVIVK